MLTFENVYMLLINKYVKAAYLQILKKIKHEKNNHKYWPSYVQWRNLLLLTP